MTTTTNAFTRSTNPGVNLDPTFSFGQNWSDFLERALTPEQVALAREQTARFLDLPSLSGLTFLDVGCGSGVFSHAAHSLGAASITSFDVDPLSVRCCTYMRQQAGSPENWEVVHGSVLDAEFVGRMPMADIVYSWGVLHHTGDMWTAIRNAATRVKPGGRFFIAIYNKVEYDSFRSYRGSQGWVRLKRAYNQAGPVGKKVMEIGFGARDIFKWLVTFRNPMAEIRAYKQNRGMSWWYDIIDWLGGYPYEYASPAEIFNFCHRELGMDLERMHTLSSIGCNEFLFIKRK